MRGIGQPWRHKVCLVGGLVPRYLVSGDGYNQPEHVGSTDVDVALRLVVEAQDDGAYATLEKNLKRNGLVRADGSSWRWMADVDGELVVLELLGDSDDATPGTIFHPRSRRLQVPAGLGCFASRVWSLHSAIHSLSHVMCCFWMVPDRPSSSR